MIKHSHCLNQFLEGAHADSTMRKSDPVKMHGITTVERGLVENCVNKTKQTRMLHVLVDPEGLTLGLYQCGWKVK